MQTKKKIILIVDDSPIVIERLKELLTTLDNSHSIIYCDSYEKAVQSLGSARPDIAILDINLPDKSGIELLRYIKNHFISTVVIMLSNQSTDQYRNLCQSLGAFRFVDKSNEFDQVPGIIYAIP